MAYTSVTKRRGIDTTASRERVLSAAEQLILAGGFTQATVSELAEVAGVSRATVFSRFGSKLGILEELAVRCAGGPQMRAIRAAVAGDDADAVLPELLEATSELWERQGHILLTLKAVAELEPGAIALIDDQRRDQRECCRVVVATLDGAGRCGDVPLTHLSAALHLITSVESFMELRRNSGLALTTTKRVLTTMAVRLFVPATAHTHTHTQS